MTEKSFCKKKNLLCEHQDGLTIAKKKDRGFMLRDDIENLSYSFKGDDQSRAVWIK